MGPMEVGLLRGAGAKKIKQDLWGVAVPTPEAFDLLLLRQPADAANLAGLS
jgi:hypothetical protein